MDGMPEHPSWIHQGWFDGESRPVASIIEDNDDDDDAGTF
jgi:hypothetical protein